MCVFLNCGVYQIGWTYISEGPLGCKSFILTKAVLGPSLKSTFLTVNIGMSLLVLLSQCLAHDGHLVSPTQQDSVPPLLRCRTGHLITHLARAIRDSHLWKQRFVPGPPPRRQQLSTVCPLTTEPCPYSKLLWASLLFLILCWKIKISRVWTLPRHSSVVRPRRALPASSGLLSPAYLFFFLTVVVFVENHCLPPLEWDS